MLRRCGCLLLLMTAVATPRLEGQATPHRLVFVIGQEITNVVPTLDPTSAAMQVADLIFLRLGRNAGTSFGDRAAVPELAKAWTRRDSVTLVFDLDPRAQWQDGAPFTSRDVVFSFDRARNPKLVPSVARLLVDIADVQAEGESRIIIRFTRPYGEQLYDATYHLQILPAHLLATIPPDSLASSAFVRAPIGTGPYRWDRSEPTQYLQLRSVPDFFLGKPAIDQLVWRFAATQEARLNLLLTGEADVQEDLLPPVSNLSRLAERPSLRLAQIPSMGVTYVLFNQRARGDTARPHPIFADTDVRRALTIGVDRATLTKAIYGKYAREASSPAPAGAWFGALAPSPVPYDSKEAARILAARGWKDHDGDGVLDRDGVPLAFSLIVSNSSAARMKAALIVQEQWRRLGVKAEVVPLDFSVFLGRRPSGDFDASLEAFAIEPSPWSLLSRWGCGASLNFGHYCNPAADSLLRAAHLALREPGTPIREWLRTLAGDYPATFLYTAEKVMTIPRVYRNVDFHVESPWLMVWTWTLAGASH